jgi:hypothetical protein
MIVKQAMSILQPHTTTTGRPAVFFLTVRFDNCPTTPGGHRTAHRKMGFSTGTLSNLDRIVFTSLSHIKVLLHLVYSLDPRAKPDLFEVNLQHPALHLFLSPG